MATAEPTRVPSVSHAKLTSDRIRWVADRLEGDHEPRHLRLAGHPPVGATDEQASIDAVRRAKVGDEHAIRLLYLRYRNSIHSYARSIVRDEHEAEDITQLVFARLLTSLPTYEPRTVPLKGWLVRVAHNAAIDALRRRHESPVAELHVAAEEDDQTAQRGRDLRNALGTLGEDQRTVIVLRLVHGLSPREIASTMGRSESSVDGLHHRARRALRAELTRTLCAPSVIDRESTAATSRAARLTTSRRAAPGAAGRESLAGA